VLDTTAIAATAALVRVADRQAFAKTCTIFMSGIPPRTFDIRRAAGGNCLARELRVALGRRIVEEPRSHGITGALHGES
jgi:hypothetical protein